MAKSSAGKRLLISFLGGLLTRELVSKLTDSERHGDRRKFPEFLAEVVWPTQDFFAVRTNATRADGGAEGLHKSGSARDAGTHIGESITGRRRRKLRVAADGSSDLAASRSDGEGDLVFRALAMLLLGSDARRSR